MTEEQGILQDIYDPIAHALRVSGGATTTFGTPAIVLGTAAAPGAASTAVRTDATVVAFDATAPVTQNYADTAATGSAAVAARRDHVHGMPASAGASFATPGIVLGSAAAAGAASTVIRSDSTIAAFDTTAPVTQALGDVAAVGTVAKAARRDHTHGMPFLSSMQAAYLPTGAVYDNGPRIFFNADLPILITATLLLVAIPLPSGLAVNSITFTSANTAGGTMTHQWFSLSDNNRVQLATTTDDTSTAWASGAKKTLSIAAIASGASATFTTTYTGLHYAGIVIVGSGTLPSLAGHSAGGGTATSGKGANAQTPILEGTSDASQAGPHAFPYTAGAPGSLGKVPYVYVS